MQIHQITINFIQKKIYQIIFQVSVSSRNNDIRESLEFFVKIKELSKVHFPFVKEYLLILIQEQKIEKATYFLTNISDEFNNFPESNIILGANYLANKKYNLAIKKLNLINEDLYSSRFDKLIADILINYSKIFDERVITEKEIFLEYF